MESYCKGIPHWYDYVHFFLSSPFRIWFWFIPWLRNDFSILAKLSQYLDNSFEEFDLNSYYVASRYSILEAIKEHLADKQLLTPELENMIAHQIVFNQNINTGQQFNVGGGTNVFSSINQKMK